MLEASALIQQRFQKKQPKLRVSWKRPARNFNLSNDGITMEPVFEFKVEHYENYLEW